MEKRIGIIGYGSTSPYWAEALAKIVASGHDQVIVIKKGSSCGASCISREEMILNIVDGLTVSHPEFDTVMLREAAEIILHERLTFKDIPAPIEPKYIEPIKSGYDLRMRKSDVQPWKKSWKK